MILITEIETFNGTYEGDQVLEGFRVNTEYLCSEKPNSFYGDEFQRQCKNDLLVINDIILNEDRNIPPITIEKLHHIISKKLKNNKACDIYQLTAEHLKFAGQKSLEILCRFINRVLENLEYYSAPEFKLSIATVIYKGKENPDHIINLIA